MQYIGISETSKLNCEVLYDDLAFEVRWAVAGESIVLQLVAKLDEREYMSFGLSGDASRSVMIGGDVAVAWVDKKTLKGYAEDYYLADKAQCSGPTGACPDNRLAIVESNNIKLLNAAMVNGYSIVTYQRPLKDSDIYDLPILTNRSQPIIWAIGPLNQRDEVSFHSHYLKTNSFLDFGRPAKWNCPMPETEQPSMIAVQSESRIRPTATEEVDETVTLTTTNSPRRNSARRRGATRRVQPTDEADDSEKSATRTQQQRRKGNQREGGTSIRAVPSPAPVSKRDAWVIPPIMCDEPDDGVFYAQMGPTGGKRGYPAITGHVGWGISWYINGLLIPEINLVRGKMYTFVVEGGQDPEVSAKYHPFYITDDPVGGYEYKTAEERKNIRIFAGVRQQNNGSLEPTGTGRLCHWTQTGDSDADDFESFGAYQRILELKCDPGEPGVIQWTPDKDTPDTVYYQCFTHRYLGWKINVLDSCDGQPAASEIKPVKVEAPTELLDKSDIDLDESPSVRIETRVNANNLFKEDKEDKKEFKSTVSEKKIIPSTLAPHSSTRQPHETLPTEPILTLPQQSYFDPFYQTTAPHFAQLSYNPYLLNQTQQYQPPQYFRPSTLLNTVHENATPNYIQEIFLSSTTTPTTTVSTTEKTTSTTERPSTTTQIPQRHTDNIAIATNNKINQTYIMPPPPANLPPKFNTVMFRRPLGPSPGYSKRPMQMPLKIVMRPPPTRQFPMQMPYKKLYRQQLKMPTLHTRPYAFPFENKPVLFSQMSPKKPTVTSYFYPQQTPPALTKAPSIQNQMANNVIVTESSIVDEVRNVEISPQQASTEREPEIQTAPSTNFMDIAQPLIRPAFNSGFRPGSVKIESGFKPIISKEFQDRMDNNEPDIEYESEMGVVNIDNSDQYEFKPIQNFEPMFVPSPTDKTVKEKRVKVHKKIIKKRYYPYTKIVLKQPRSLPDTMEEPVAEAAERVETYYLPPSDNKNTPVDVIRQPSNIDIEAPDFSNIDSPPDVVVAYDGKKVSGQSLTAKLTDYSTVLDQRMSKITEYIKAMPQVGKFKGELPPLNPAFIDKNAPQLQSKSGVLNRDLDTPSLPPSSYLPQGLTRLSRVRKEDKNVGSRRKRAAHHTPEHTAQQEAEKLNNTTSSSTKLKFSVASYPSIIVVAYILKYL